MRVVSYAERSAMGLGDEDEEELLIDTSHQCSSPFEDERLFREEIVERVIVAPTPTCRRRFQKRARKCLPITALAGAALAGIARNFIPWKAASHCIVATVVDVFSGIATMMLGIKNLSAKNLTNVKRTLLPYSAQSLLLWKFIHYAFLPKSRVAEINMTAIRMFSGICFTASFHSRDRIDPLTVPLSYVSSTNQVMDDTPEAAIEETTQQPRKLQLMTRNNSRQAFFINIAQAIASSVFVGLGFVFYPDYEVLNALGFVYLFDGIGRALVNLQYDALVQRMKNTEVTILENENGNFPDVPRPILRSLKLISILRKHAFLTGFFLSFRSGAALVGLLNGTREEQDRIVFSESNPNDLPLTDNLDPISDNETINAIKRMGKVAIAEIVLLTVAANIFRNINAFQRSLVICATIGLISGGMSSCSIRKSFNPQENDRLKNEVYFRSHFGQIAPVFPYMVMDNVNLRKLSSSTSFENIMNVFLANMALLHYPTALSTDAFRKETLPSKMSAFSELVHSRFLGLSIQGISA